MKDIVYPLVVKSTRALDLAHQKECITLWCSYIQSFPFTGTCSLSSFVKNFKIQFKGFGQNFLNMCGLHMIFVCFQAGVCVCVYADMCMQVRVCAYVHHIEPSINWETFKIIKQHVSAALRSGHTGSRDVVTSPGGLLCSVR